MTLHCRLFMGDSDELFARTIAGLDIPSTFGYNKQSKYLHRINYDCFLCFSDQNVMLHRNCSVSS